MSPKESPAPWLELDPQPVQRIVPANPAQRFEGVDFAGCGSILAIATSEANTVLLFRRRPDGRFDDVPYQTISRGSHLEYPHDVSFSRAQGDALLAVAQGPGLHPRQDRRRRALHPGGGDGDQRGAIGARLFGRRRLRAAGR